MLTPAPLRLPELHPLAKQVLSAMQPTAHGLRIPETRWDDIVERLRSDGQGAAVCKDLTLKALELEAKRCRNSSEQLLTLVIVALGAVEASRVLAESGMSRMAVNSAVHRAQATHKPSHQKR